MLDAEGLVRTRCWAMRVVQDGRRTTPSAAVQMGRSHRQAVLLSAFETLASTSPKIIDALTLSVPVEGGDEAAALRKLGLKLAEKHDMHADTTVDDNHLIVRLTRR